MRFLTGWILLTVLLGAPAAGQRVAFPLRVSENGRYFTDQQARPFLYHADTGWQIFARLTLPEAREYLTTRKNQGFNTLQVQISMNPDSVSRAGHKPFVDYDFARPHEGYFAHVERVIQVADSLNLLLNIAPFWIGCCREGYGVGAKTEVYARNGPDKARRLGEYLGRRFGKYNNIIWTMGGDNDPRSIRKEIEALAEGLHRTAPRQLITYHASPPHSSTDLFQYAPWLGYSMIYTYWREKPNEWVDPQQLVHVYEAALREYNKTDRLPFILGEAQYEGDGRLYNNDIGTPQHIRRQAWWTLLSGGTGHAYGHDGWAFPQNWRSILQYPAGSQHLRQFITYFESIPWWRLVPDQKHQTLVAGYGEYTKANYVTAALTDDGTLLVAYLPEPGRVKVDLSRLKGAQVTARWLDPRTGRFADAGKFPNQGIKQFTSPPQDDWVLEIRAGQ
ncbi:glycoside hydrolase family 140 protein [Tellurirhabdus rosea]|uniref:glycoside hydrolase family 140 protein n=1 Tax=Tellurirhabdus rosea TaxID=2674997 RepID=UPI0022518541|nr:glycoside hydrolase family 140 protein [Tellurirhabdus rosea]